MTPVPIPASRSWSGPRGPLAALALSLACLCGPVAADGWSFTKVITVNHFGDREDNDGFRPESFYFEKEFGESSRWMVGFIENSEGRTGPSIGYSYDFQRGEDWDFYGKILVATNYKKDSNTKLIPLLGIRYHLTESLDLMLDGMYVPRSDEHYLLVITGVNYDF